MNFSIIGFVAFFISALLVYWVREISRRKGFLTKPRSDRWHIKATASLGGVGIYLATGISLLIYAAVVRDIHAIRWGIFLGGSIIFGLGLYDDIKHLSPQAKILGQLLAASFIVLLGYTTNFFTPRINNELIAELPNTLVTIFWIIGITNAINLLDNMDGLAGGIALIVAIILSFFFAQGGDFGSLSISVALVGSILGFLIFNFPPASIFMGDSGSLFLGFCLAVLAIAKQPQASNVFAVLGVPTILFLLPIFDTLLVTITRLLRGQSPMHGGRDHTSHRLIAFGFTERQTVVGLYIIALISGIVAIILESLDYDLSLVLVPLLVISLALFSAYLGRIKVVVPETTTPYKGTMLRLVLEMAYRRRIFELLLDTFLIGVAYYLAFWTRFGLVVNEEMFKLYLQTLPIILIGCYLSFFLFGIYRDAWGFVGIDTLVGYLKASIGAAFLSVILLFFIFKEQPIYFELFLLFCIFLFLGLAATRSSFKIFDLFSNKRSDHIIEQVLIFGAGERGEMAANWLQMNPNLGMKPIGFITSQSIDIGRRIHGISILGGVDQLKILLEQNDIQGVIITDTDISNSILDRILDLGAEYHCWVKKLSLELKLIGE